MTVLESSPIGKGPEGLALYSELWSKLRWAVGDTLGLSYGKKGWAGQMARRLALLVLANYDYKHNENGHLVR